MSTTHTAVFENAILKSTELKADTKIAVGLDTEQTTKELTVVGDAPEIRIQDKTGSNPEVNQTTLSIVADGGVTHFRAGTSTFDTTETKGDIKFQSSTGDSTHAIITGTGRVGVGTMAPTESLDIVGNINLQKVSNTATIKLDSNVVTEYARSKKLIKYPRVAMTSNTTPSQYFVAQNAVNSTDNRKAWAVFNNIPHLGDGDTYHASDTDLSRYNTTTGVYEQGETFLNTGIEGDWIYIRLDDSIQLKQVILYPRAILPKRQPVSGTILGSNDGTNWSTIFTWDDIAQDASVKTFDVGSTTLYNYFGFVWRKVGTYNNGYVNFNELELYGVPEYDPEAHGTDTIMRSAPNVPTTDWLEVYYDAGETSSYSGSGTTVSDIKPNGNAVNGTLRNGVGFDSTWKAFTFDGTDDYIDATISLAGGDYVHSFSAWMKLDDKSQDAYLFHLGNQTNSQSIGFHTRYNDNEFRYFFYGNDLDVYIDYKPHTWYHICGTYSGGGTSTASVNLYVNGVHMTPDSNNNLGSALSTPTSTTLYIGRASWGSGSYFNGSIANFRLFNRSLTTDEVWQLYAYQKEYFQVSPDVVTFKGGRLGIGTSEPRAVLDVRGSVQISGFSQVSGGGGTVYTNSKYVVHKFTSSGTFTILEPGLIEYIVVGGGGGGGSRHQGGGGGGGVLVGTMYASKGDYAVTIGAGGSGNAGGSVSGLGGHGSGSTFAGLIGMGGGGANNYNEAADYVGCSGGTSAVNSGVNPIIPPQGYGIQGWYGGRGNPNASSPRSYAGGGGGGAGGAGGAASPTGGDANTSGGDGGPGRCIYGLGADDSDVYLGGGGGGDCFSGSSGSAGSGGIGGGGDGSKGNAQASDGEANTGGGGGGGGFSSSSPPNGPGGDGGSGVVYVRYLK